MRIKYFKQTITIMTILSLLFMVLGIQGNNNVEAATTVAPPAPINQIFPDADLAEGIRVELQKSSVTDVVTKEELESITNLTVVAKKIASIEGLEYLTNLEFLNLNGNQITDLSPLSNLTKLTEIYIGDNKISDISPLQNLTNVTNLYLKDNDISDLSPLANLTQMYSLRLGGNSNISDLNPVRNMTRLDNLEVTESILKDLTPLADVTSLTRLSLSYNQIEDLSPLAGLTKLNNIAAYSNKITDITPVTNLTRLQYLSLGDNEITDVSPVANLQKLTSLQLANNQITNISMLEDLTNLTSLDLQHNKISDISVLGNLTHVTYLQLGYNQIVDVKIIGGLTNLTSLQLTQNHITDISPLANLTKIQSSDFSNQMITNPERNFSKTLSVPNNITSTDGTLIAPETISNNGTYDAPNLKWSLPNYLPEVKYTFSQKIPIGTGTSNYSGFITQPLKELLDYKVTFNVEGNASEVETVTEENLIPEPTSPTKKGYTFDGWYDAETGGTKWDFATGQMPANDITLYAHFSVNNYQANFNVDGAVTNETVVYDTLLEEPTAPTKIGYTFDGWYDAATGGTKWDFTTMKMPANDVTLYAHFTLNDYHVNFVIDSKVTDEDVANDTLVPEPTMPTKQGYTFDGWYDAETGGTKWDFATMKMPANDVTLYAHFFVNNYQANFNVDGAVTNETVVYDTLLEEPTAPTKQGYTFDGWYDAETGGTKWDFATMKMPANDITLYAHFSKETPLIPDPTNGPSEDSTDGPVPTNEPTKNNNLTITPKEPTSGQIIAKTATLPKTGDDTPWKALLAGIVLSSSAFVIWRKKA
ncbi:InlB B-repeat-containing protein [Listeria marthii]|nr:InlB B-repeat-containing protein [Listeria marthii]